jgi:hypothetical protein
MSKQQEEKASLMACTIIIEFIFPGGVCRNDMIDECQDSAHDPVTRALQPSKRISVILHGPSGAPSYISWVADTSLYMLLALGMRQQQDQPSSVTGLSCMPGNMASSTI